MCRNVHGREALMLFLTIARLGPAAGLCWSVWVGYSPYVSLSWMIGLLLADYFDGVLARRLGVDNVHRRIADVIVDRISIHSAMVVIIFCAPSAVWLTLPVVIRDVVLILWSINLLRAKRTIITAGNIHRIGTFSYAILYIAVLFSTGSAVTWMAAAISLVVWFLLIDYIRAGLLVPVNPKGQPTARYQAIQLRALRGIVPPRQDALGL